MTPKVCIIPIKAHSTVSSVNPIKAHPAVYTINPIKAHPAVYTINPIKAHPAGIYCESTHCELRQQFSDNNILEWEVVKKVMLCVYYDEYYFCLLKLMVLTQWVSKSLKSRRPFRKCFSVLNLTVGIRVSSHALCVRGLYNV